MTTPPADVEGPVTTTVTRRIKPGHEAPFGGPGRSRPASGPRRRGAERGTAGSTEWLLRARPDVDGALGEGHSLDEDTTGQLLVDPCLKLAGGERLCGGTQTEASPGRYSLHHGGPTSPEDGTEFPGFVIAMTAEPAETMRVHTASGQVTAALHPLPGTNYRGGVALVAGEPESGPACQAPAEPFSEPADVVLLDASGQPGPGIDRRPTVAKVSADKATTAGGPRREISGTATRHARPAPARSAK